MNRTVFAALLFFGLVPVCGSAVEIINIRPCYGPFGATRFDKKIIPADAFYMTYDIAGLAVDAKSGEVSYDITLEFIDPQGKVVFSKQASQRALPELGGATMPGELVVETSIKQAPGTYTIKLTVEDKNGKNAKAFKYDVEVLPAGPFGMIGVVAPTIGLPRHTYLATCALVNVGLDAKKEPNVEVAFRILDKDGKKVAPDILMSYPRDLKGADFTKANFIPMEFPVFLNRAGRFSVEIVAEDKINKKKTELRYPLTVIDVNALSGR